MKKITLHLKSFAIIFIMVIAAAAATAQDFTEADIPAVKEIQTTILDLVVKAVSNFDALRLAESYRDSSLVLYNATATPAMHAQQYYITYVEKNKKSYYMSYYTTPHDMLLAMMAVNTMNAFAGNKWEVKLASSNKGIITNDLYCAGTKLGTMRQNTVDHTVAVSIGFFSDPPSAQATSGSSGAAPAADAKPADHFKSISQRMADIQAGLMERHGVPIKHAERIVNFSEGSYSEIIKWGMLAYYYSGFKRYFISPTLYSKKYPIPFGARITYQLVNDKNEVLNEQTLSGNELECYFDIPEDGDYTIQAKYDFEGCAGCTDVPGTRIQFGLYSQDFDKKQP